MAVKKEIARTGWQDLAGIILLAISLMLFLCMFSYDYRDIPVLYTPSNAHANTLIGPVGAWAAFLLFMGLGPAAYLFPAGLLLIALHYLFRREGVSWPKLIWHGLILVSLACLVDLRPDWYESMAVRLNIRGMAGGMIGRGLTRSLLVPFIGEGGTIILCSAALAVGLIFFFNISPLQVARWIGGRMSALHGRYVEWKKARMDRRELIEYEQQQIEKQRRKLQKSRREPAGEDDEDEQAPAALPPAPIPAAPAPRKRPEPKPEPEHEEPPPPERVPPPPPPPPPPKPRPPRPEKPKEPPPETAATALSVAAGASVFKLPPLSLLEPLPPADQREIRAGDVESVGKMLIETLAEFGVEAELRGAESGPVVTRFEIRPAAGVRVERITSLSNNIALALMAESVRIQAPIPGKDAVGIEVPNLKTTTVYLREVLESEQWRSGRAALPLALGKDVSGKVIISDLAEMPHMLIAGATGSGKTVCMNSLLAGLMMSRTPDELRLMLVDPKIVEFAAYSNLPHLVVPVITDAKKVALGLRWAITEMETRYKILAKAGVRNIKSFNSRPIVKQPDLFAEVAGGPDGTAVPPPPPPPKPDIPDRLPYIVIVVDELADLMLVAQADIETSIARLAQLSRAVGIHMILATQRPSVNVITGTIKANFPARLAFQVAQKVDSRTILDTNGADKLLGKGDMLFLPPGSSKVVRAQGCLTTDHDVHTIADYWRNQGQPKFEMSIKDKIEKKGSDIPDMEEDDELIEASIEIIRQTHRASTSSLQRRLRIGYTRAARIMDLLEERGIVGPAQGSDPRDILIDLDGEIPQNDTRTPAPEDET